jgi:hypothetical protein
MKIYFLQIVDGEKTLMSVDQDVNGNTAIILGIEFRVMNIPVTGETVAFAILKDTAPTKIAPRLNELVKLYENKAAQ